MQELKKFEKAGNDQNKKSNHGRFHRGEEKIDKKAPEYFIEDASKRVVDPLGGRACVELGVKTC